MASINTGKIVAGLGPKWGEMIDERLIIERKGMRRILKIDLSHRLPIDECNFSITENGLLPIIDWYIYINMMNNIYIYKIKIKDN